MPSTENSPNFETHSRQVLTFLVVCISIIGVLALASVVIFSNSKPETQLDTAKFVFGAVLPLLASWVGTILAYYFSKENFAIATQSVSALASTISSADRLQSISVRDKMRPLASIKYMQLHSGGEKDVKLAELDKRFEKVERMLFLNDNGSFAYLIYRAMVDQFLTKFSQGAQLPQNVSSLADLTLLHFLDSDAKLKSMFQNGVGFVSVNSSLADAKRAMEKIEKCGDVFVTNLGDRKETILGWITDNKILELARV